MRRLLVLLALVLLGLSAPGLAQIPVPDILDVPTGFAAKELCSGVFVAGLDEEKVIREDVDIAALVTDLEVDYEAKTTLAKYKGTGDLPFKAIYRDGVGCTIVDGLTEEELRAQDLGDQSALPALNASVPWPLGDLVEIEVPPEVDYEELQRIVDKDFRNPLFNTRAILVVYKGRIILEQYADGITKDSRLLGWSMTKSVTSALVGILVGEGRLRLQDLAPVKEWEDPADPRHNITLESLLHMSSGLRWAEGYDVPNCLYASGQDCASYAAGMALRDPVHTKWEYSTGTTTIIARIIMENRDMRGVTDFEYYREKLFRRINIHNAIVEHQANGDLLGGSNAFMPARDWARFGHLYMNDGVWDGQRILPEGWVDYTRTPAPTRSTYGAQWWIRSQPVSDLFYMGGFRNQNVFLMPSKNLMVVRLAMPSIVLSNVWDQDEFLTPLVACFP